MDWTSQNSIKFLTLLHGVFTFWQNKPHEEYWDYYANEEPRIDDSHSDAYCNCPEEALSNEYAEWWKNIVNHSDILWEAGHYSANRVLVKKEYFSPQNSVCYKVMQVCTRCNDDPENDECTHQAEHNVDDHSSHEHARVEKARLLFFVGLRCPISQSKAGC